MLKGYRWCRCECGASYRGAVGLQRRRWLQRAVNAGGLGLCPTNILVARGALHSASLGARGGDFQQACVGLEERRHLLLPPESLQVRVQRQLIC